MSPSNVSSGWKRSAMNEEIKKQIQEVHAWLDKHVQVFTEPQAVTLSDFSVNWDEFSGDFKATLDSVALPVKLRFGLEASGETKFHLPMFHSPLGAPASYAAIEMTPRTLAAITQGLHQAIPRVMAAGSDKVTGQKTDFATPARQRLSAEALKSAMARIIKGYTLTIALKDAS